MVESRASLVEESSQTSSNPNGFQSQNPDSKSATSNGSGKSRRTVQSVSRALDILEVLAESGSDMKLNEISTLTNLNVSTCHHLLTTLAERGYVSQNPRGRTYFVGNRIVELSLSKSRHQNLVDLALEDLKTLNRNTKETICLAEMRGYSLTTLLTMESPHPVRVGTDAAGRSNALHATAIGKAILAWLPEAEIARVVEENELHRFTEHTITDIEKLFDNLRHVRRNGYAIDREEYQHGVMCIGTAIRNYTGAVLGSVGCCLPVMRANPDYLERIRFNVMRCAATISEKLGQSDN
ncbi:MAG: IclR family transcriptional regulator [Methyloligellaceae bacterium]